MLLSNICSREEWNGNPMASRCVISIFTAVSVTDTGTGIGIYLQIPKVGETHRIDKGCSKLRTESTGKQNNRSKSVMSSRVVLS